MFKPFAAAFVLAIAATPVLAEGASIPSFGVSAAKALNYLTLDGGAHAASREVQAPEARLANAPDIRSRSASERVQVFAGVKPAAGRSADGFRGFGRIDR